MLCPSFYQIKFPFTQDDLNLVWSPVVLEKKDLSKLSFIVLLSFPFEKGVKGVDFFI